MEVPLTLLPCRTETLDGNVGLVSGARVAVAEAMFELTPAIIDKVAFETGGSGGLVLARFPNPKIEGVIALTEAAVAK